MKYGNPYLQAQAFAIHALKKEITAAETGVYTLLSVIGK